MRRREREGDEPADIAAVTTLVCGSCGQLGWPDTAGASGYRSDETVPAVSPRCTHCAAQSWIDLGHEPMALALRGNEDDHASAKKGGRVRLVGRIAAASLVGFVFGFPMVGWPWIAGTIAALVGIVVGLLTYREHLKLRPEASMLPTRWAMALPPDGQPTELAVGPTHPTAELLRAPISGRPCLAFEVGIRHDAQPDADLGTWALLEQQIAPCRVDGEAIDPAATHLELPRQRLGALSGLSLDPAARAYLEQRGFGSVHDPLEVYESILEAQAPVRVLEVGGGRILQPTSTPAVNAHASP